MMTGGGRRPAGGPPAAKKPVSIEEAALRHLANRSRTAAELRRHLAGKGYDDEAVKELLVRFADYGYVDDARYCREYFRYSLGKGKGKRRIFAELREKGVDALLIERAYEDYCEEEGEPDERQRAKDEAAKVLRSAGVEPGEAVPEKLLARAARRLASKGYSSDVIYSVIGELRE